MVELPRDSYFTITFHMERQLLPQTPPAYPAEERFTPSKDDKIYSSFTGAWTTKAGKQLFFEWWRTAVLREFIVPFKVTFKKDCMSYSRQLVHTTYNITIVWVLKAPI